MVVVYAFSLAKLYQSGNEIHMIDYIEIFNSNTFSTFISMVICMAYKFFTTDENKQELDSGLSRKWIWLTILATIIYGMCAVINASRYCLITSVIMAAASLAYIILFFKVMRKKEIWLQQFMDIDRGDYYVEQSMWGIYKGI